MIYIYTSKKAGALGLSEKNKWVELLPVKIAGKSGISGSKTSGHEINSSDQVYIDISGLTPAELKKNLAILKKSAAFWGVIDPKGSVEDPALLFFEGAGDYIGPAPVKKGLKEKRFTAALSRDRSGYSAKSITDENEITRKVQKLPSGKFGGWKSVLTGEEGSFFFLFVSLSGKAPLRSMLGEDTFNHVKNQLRDVLHQGLLDANALLWMETESNSLFLVPPSRNNGRAVIEAALKLVLNSRLVALENLGLSFPVKFVYALHYGQTLFQAPGKTGAVISESVNYIFHLGTKKSEAGRLTISGDVPEEAIPDGLKDLFVPAGVFEGIPIRHSRRFVYR